MTKHYEKVKYYAIQIIKNKYIYLKNHAYVQTNYMK